MPEPLWQVPAVTAPPDWFIQAVQQVVPGVSRSYIAQLLWQRGICNPEQLAGFFHPDRYQPASPFALGPEMQLAVKRLQQAYHQQEIVAIWGDFDADGVTATAVLWEGLGQFFTQHKSLVYYIPNRLTESHGLSQQGLDRLQNKGCQLIVTCDTGSTNLAEIEYAHDLGMDVIVTDHHTLPATRPPVAAIVNPRYLAADHSLATLSGVAVAYKLVEALYEALPEIPTQPLEQLLDLVAIGLIADLVELKGDCRYLAQRGIEQLQKQANPLTANRPGLTRLLELCKRSGDRPTDISFGLGPRINAVSRIQGDADFCVELLTSQDAHLCRHLAEATELANARRKALQKEVMQQVTDRLAQLDLSTTQVIVLADEQWEPGVLGLVAGQIAQEYGRPTILLNAAPLTGEGLARGSARSVNQIDLYQLVKDQEHLLYRFGGHPYAAGLSLPIANIPLFTEAINQRSRQLFDVEAIPSVQADLIVTVAELGKELFQELKLLEPCGMGNSVPKLLIQNCWFTKIWNKKIQDWKGSQVQYIKTEFELWDDSAAKGFPGLWWGHYRDEIPQGRCDVIVELDSNNFKKRYEVRLIAVRASQTSVTSSSPATSEWIVDWRDTNAMQVADDRTTLILQHCPSNWTTLQLYARRARQEGRKLAIAYSPPQFTAPEDLWTQLIGIAKYLSRTGKTATRQQLQDKLEIGDRALQAGFKALAFLGFQIRYLDQSFQVSWATQQSALESDTLQAMEQFFMTVREEQFLRQYFYQMPLATIRAIATLNQEGQNPW